MPKMLPTRNRDPSYVVQTWPAWLGRRQRGPWPARQVVSPNAVRETRHGDDPAIAGREMSPR